MQITQQPPLRLSQSERLARMRLARSTNVGPVTFQKLLARFGTGCDAIDALPALAAQNGKGRKIEIASRETVIAEIEQGKACGARPIIFGDPDYPDLLAQIEDAPPYFYAIGRTELLMQPAIGMVGARNASANGRGFARKLAHEVSEAGYIVVSGMARGIDGAAHDAALDPSLNGSGGTIAVLGGGVDVVYPREHQELYERICHQGCVISEMPPGLTPQARHFPRRNRIISGLSRGIVVVEASRNSGSLITARFAGEQGRDVFAVPGSPTDPRSAGPNSLLRDGAILCDSGDVLIDALRDYDPSTHLFDAKNQFNASTHQTTPKPNHDQIDDILDHDADSGQNTYINIPSEPIDLSAAPLKKQEPITTLKTADQILDLLSPAPLLIDELIRVSGLTATSVSTMLIELELAGRVERHPGNRVSRIAK
ncbi:DNA-processing protein DprA [Thalassospira sp. MA62]|nr:DNA-processing protein DprA [Thalassospira sp. MA62]